MSRTLTLNRAAPKPNLPRVGISIADVLTDWGIDDLTHPLHTPVSRLLSGGAKTGSDGLFHLKAALALLEGIRADRARQGFSWGKAPFDLEARGVATAFSLSTLLGGALLELRWAAFAGTREAAQGHLDQAIARVRDEIGIREGKGT